MINKTICGLFISMTVMMLSSCNKDELYVTPHPQSGAVIVTADWTGKSPDAEIPFSYALQIGETVQEVSGASNRFEQLLSPGSYKLTAYNLPPGMALNGTTMSVNTIAGGMIEPVPGHLFIGGKDFSITADTDMALTVPMEQYTRRIDLVLSITEGDFERVASATGTLTGICGAVDIATGSRSGKTMKTAAAVVRDGNKFRLVYNLLGIVPEARQMLTINVTFTNGDTQSIESDISDMLATFHEEHSPLHLTGNLLLPVEGGVFGVISGWQVTDGGNADAH